MMSWLPAFMLPPNASHCCLVLVFRGPATTKADVEEGMAVGQVWQSQI